MYNSNFSFHEIYIPDQICNNKCKTQMELYKYKNIHISYTQSSIAEDSTNLLIPFGALTILTGQKVTYVWSKKSIYSWKLRKNNLIGCKVTLRGRSFFLFLDKLYLYGFFGEQTLCFYFLEKKFQKNYGFKNVDLFLELEELGISVSMFSGFSITIS